jgi:glyoxylase-like metal-dependent hydrolase (beta-lactamase superfamily II)
VITHGHADHLGDIFRLHQLYYPQTVWTPRHLTDDEIRVGNQAGDMKLVDQYLSVRRAYTIPLSPEGESELLGRTLQGKGTAS